MTESQNNGGSNFNGGSFANGDSTANGQAIDDLGNLVGQCRDQAWDLRGHGLHRFPHLYAHTPNGG